MSAPAVSVDELEALIREGVPLVGNYGITIEQLGSGTVRMKLPYNDSFVRPGGTVTGPAMFGLADVALYAAVLSLIGRVELAVTTSMTINFLRRPAPVAITADCRILKMGKRLAYGEVLLFSEGDPEPVAHATGTYSIPPHEPVTLAVSGYHNPDAE
ncbi:PaaI family thioesterase [Roseomonas genomospecies 6]|uniref:PaaI family thioesterase n=1 Tax=Roseomonas genomospecies 6 TaxID=214106 RepID=A0A9W7KN65_9PROT|nr:PaaI family thioesterase [Roseomonas genomospecies 6]KAA0675904.1 PaaI family thioesterase [Roseomonas genomospecies 6]